MELSFFKNCKVLVTGHTGFKGAWICKVLLNAGAQVSGYALPAPTSPSLFELCHLSDHMNSVIGDIRDISRLQRVFEEIKPDIVIHMAAQPIVRDSYASPVYTYDVNVMGTVNVLECIRLSDSVRSFINVTTDKVYLNREWEWGYRENEELNGYDPYSNSKSCSELVTASYRNSFFSDKITAVSTVRAGNVIGGGDFAKDRIIPDCIRAVQNNQKIILRSPHSIRPYQHVLEPINAYLMIAQKQYENKRLEGSYNVGPDDNDCWETGKLVALFCNKWNTIVGGPPVTWDSISDHGPHEATFLKLDCSKIKHVFRWKPRWNMDIAMDKIVEWSEIYLKGGNAAACMERQITDYYSE